MVDREGTHSRDRAVELTRRRALTLAGSGVIGAGVARVVYEYTGFGTVTGTNLVEQRLGEMARRRLAPSSFSLRLSDHRLAFDGAVIELRDGSGERVDSVPLADAPADDSRERSEPLVDLAADLRLIEAGDFTFEFTTRGRFFDRLEEGRGRPLTVAALRGDRFRRPSLETVRRFTGSEPSRPESLVTGLADGFREHTHFDYSRYVAGSIQDHVLFETVPIQAPFREPTHFEAILNGTSGLYCYEYTLRSIEAFHAVPPHRQSTPVFGAIVIDTRHNHAYTGLASVVRENGELYVPMTFLDYYYAALFDTLGLRWAFGEGIDAYNERHRATSIHYGNLYRD